jgi:hypothetical protein
MLMTEHRPYRTRTSVLFALHAPRAVILRRGPRSHHRLIVWNTDDDTFEAGQWMKGNVRLCDLSPSGTMLTHARRIGTREALLRYLSAYPHGLNQVEARTALAAIETAEARDRAERAAWTAAQEAGTEKAFRIYVSSHPNGSNTAAALQMLAALSAAEQERDRDDAASSQAQQNNTQAALSDHIATHPSGRHVQSARARLASLRAGEAKAPPVSGVKATKQAAPSEVKAVGPATLRRRSADEPFVGADGRIR